MGTTTETLERSSMMRLKDVTGDLNMFHINILIS